MTEFIIGFVSGFIGAVVVTIVIMKAFQDQEEDDHDQFRPMEDDHENFWYHDVPADFQPVTSAKINSVDPGFLRDSSTREEIFVGDFLYRPPPFNVNDHGPTELNDHGPIEDDHGLIPLCNDYDCDEVGPGHSWCHLGLGHVGRHVFNGRG